MLEGSLGVQGQDAGIGHARRSHADTEEGSLSAPRDTNTKLPGANRLGSVALEGLDNALQR
eukprot:6954910-Alexandrium_andersonii.AAC.1